MKIHWWRTQTVTVTGVSSGELIVKITADGTNLTLSVTNYAGTPQGNSPQSVTLEGSSSTPNNNNWTLNQNNTLPYMDYYKHTTAVGGSSEKIKYQPDSILVDAGVTATLPNENNPGTYDGTITWGSNPAGIAVSLGGLVSSGQPGVGTVDERTTSDILPEAPASDWFVAPDVTGALLTNPLRPFVTILSDTTTLSERQAWVLLGLAFVLFVIIAVGTRARGHQMITGIATGVAISVLVVMTIWPMWSLVFAILAVVGGVVSERSPTL